MSRLLSRQSCRSLIRCAFGVEHDEPDGQPIVCRATPALRVGTARTQAGALHAKRYLIIDRDTKYSEQFRRLIRDNGTKVIRLPPMSPNLNAYAERFVRSIKDECLNRMIFIGQASLRRAVAEYLDHYH